MTEDEINAIHAYLRLRGDVAALFAIDVVVVEAGQAPTAAVQRINEILTRAMANE